MYARGFTRTVEGCYASTPMLTVLVDQDVHIETDVSIGFPGAQVSDHALIAQELAFRAFVA